MSPSLQKNNSQTPGLLERLQNDLSRLSIVINGLSDLPDENIFVLNIGPLLNDIHRSLVRLETLCQSIQISTVEDNAYIDENVDCITVPNEAWNDLSRDTRRIKKLAKQLNLALTKVRYGIGSLPAQTQIPVEIRKANQAFLNVIGGLASSWNEPQS